MKTVDLFLLQLLFMVIMGSNKCDDDGDDQNIQYNNAYADDEDYNAAV